MLTNAQKQARFRQRRDARLQSLEEEHERGELLRWLEDHDDDEPIDDLRERVRLLISKIMIPMNRPMFCVSASSCCGISKVMTPMNRPTASVSGSSCSG
jgi:hypothetical protein